MPRQPPELRPIDRVVFFTDAVVAIDDAPDPAAPRGCGAMATDPLQLAPYIGTMLVTSLLMAAIQFVLLCNPQLLVDGEPAVSGDLAPALANSITFAAALAIALVIPGAGFWSLLALFLRGPLGRLLRHWPS